jgi:hypothetical protein
MIAQLTMDLSPWDQTPFAPMADVLTRTCVTLITTTTTTANPTPAEPTVKPIDHAELVLPTLTAEHWMEELFLTNQDVKLMEPAVLAPSTLIALPLPLTAEPMEVVMLAPANLLDKSVEFAMEERSLNNLTAILLPISA